jgi:hypothetical protein
VLAAVLVDDALAPSPYLHHRSPALLALAALIGTALLAFGPRVRSTGVVLGAGIAAGGALATAASGVAWGGVPDPLVSGAIAFNIADVAIAAGDALLVGAALAHVWTTRSRLRARP